MGLLRNSWKFYAATEKIEQSSVFIAFVLLRASYLSDFKIKAFWLSMRFKDCQQLVRQSFFSLLLVLVTLLPKDSSNVQAVFFS